MAAPSEALDCLAPGAEGMLGLRIGGLFGILVSSAVGVMIPYFAYSKELKSLFFLLRAFAAGVVLTTGFVHVLADAFPILMDPCLGLSGEYPWAMTFASAAALLTFTFEWYLRKRFRSQLSTTTPASGEAAMLGSAKEEGAIAEPLADVESGAATHSAKLAVLDNLVVAYTFEAGIIFHSIFIGITFGITSNASTAVALMIALLFHQANEGLALGVLFVKAQRSRLQYFLAASAFILITPIGVAIGIGLGASYNGSSKAALATEGVFDSVSAGILIYNGLVDLVVPTFADDELPKSSLLQAAGFAALFLGAGIMALIGKWA